MTQWALVADIGGTHARFGLADLAGGVIRDPMTLVNAEHAGLDAAIASYLDRSSTTGRVESAAIAMAGPVRDDGAQLTNGAWGFRTQELRAHLGLAALHVLNDFEALALSLPELAASDLVQIGGGVGNPAGVRIVMGPGTGFGGAVLVPGKVARIIPGEIGHTSLPIRGPAEAEIAAGLADAGGHIPVENALSGPGLVALYRRCADLRGEVDARADAASVVESARTGRDPVASEALTLFLTWLGRVAGDAAMQLRADGGIYIGGGIAPRMLDLLLDGRFRRAFDNMGRMAELVRPIPAHVIVAEAPALIGAAAFLRHRRG